MPRVDTRVAAIFRAGGDPIIPGQQSLSQRDGLFIAAREHIIVTSELREIDKPYHGS